MWVVAATRGTCLLVTRQEEGGVSRERLDAVASTTDGFELSRIDLAQRREGDILGAAQSGSKSTLRFLRALADADIIEGPARMPARWLRRTRRWRSTRRWRARLTAPWTLTVRRSSAGDKRPTGGERPARSNRNCTTPPLR